MHTVANREDILRLAMQLSPEERAEWVKDLSVTIPPEALSEIDNAWLEEVRHRYDDFKSGKLKLIPGERVFPERMP